MTILRGACQCRRIEVSFETSMPVDELPLRACACEFCRSHDAKTIADPNGHLTISAPPDAIERYRFGLQTADYLICRTCRTYVAAVIANDGHARATLNAAGTKLEDLQDRPAQPVHYDGEEAGARRARRIVHWTPTEIVERKIIEVGVG
jgi:hypothetical protein